MSYDPPRPVGRLLLTPQDREAPARIERLRALGLGERPEPALDAFADRLAARTRAPYAMVNLPGPHEQFYAGLHRPDRDVLDVDTPAPTTPAEDRDPSVTRRELGRRLARDHGFCPHVVARRKALVLEDVRDYPRFAGNAIVDAFGIRSYLGAPLIDGTGTVLGTVCVVDVTPRPWGREGLRIIKAAAADLTRRLEHWPGP
ncbi:MULTISPECIES: GAF domain-containing protein [Streptomyces]|uniref:GAF domain-containing protein n=1 Tax=Streptomyces thermoviolaceus subsp. thermoviolaceus TaxID=66860 RepID=A0ABX0YLH4_STRTL|nr:MULTISPECIES: GAF domain-containing protein [Streptomyces]MCM3266466.1 GAF domain-containing protein [Streptomyces thermoviolaceus]NJP13363.1 GAF domain-containing protein [Streptomyces thermoviolaceus subsp. thermoviolaceus]RSR98652.1 GAF domain-containing protein [Streptomyces sp. WAC00469]WTD46466.1 GAF domain-containing protein [Streptomyces thermoviolaceus]GGV66968.1 histidine kinase [Streptomyces thermoviolaceus subsp. apingens]